MRLIARSLAIALALLLSYQGWLSSARPVGGHTLRGLHDMVFCDGNIIRAQRFLHERNDHSIVFVGTSLTTILEPYMRFYDDVACLGMPGMGAFDGLAVLERSQARPRLVMIEINMLQRGLNHELMEEAMHPRLFWLNRRVMASRHEYQPANLLVPRLEAAWRGAKVAPPPTLRPQPLPPDHQHFVAENRGRLDCLNTDVENALNNLPKLQEQLQRLGLPVGLYQLPEHGEINRSPFMKQLRDTISTRLKEPVWVPPIDDYCTSDGEHLCDEDASDCALHLLEYAHRRSTAGR